MRHTRLEWVTENVIAVLLIELLQSALGEELRLSAVSLHVLVAHGQLLPNSLLRFDLWSLV